MKRPTRAQVDAAPTPTRIYDRTYTITVNGDPMILASNNTAPWVNVRHHVDYYRRLNPSATVQVTWCPLQDQDPTLSE